MSIRNGLFAVSLVLLSGCAVNAQAPEVDDGDDAEATDAIGTSEQAYVTIRRDYRKCISPLCGGWWVKDANRKTDEQYVSALDFAKSGLDEYWQGVVTGAADGEVILRGKLGPKEATFGTRTLLVTEAYRGMPGVKVEEGDFFYKASHRSPEIKCFTAPCNNEIAAKLNYSTRTPFTSYSVAKASLIHVDQDWLTGRVSRKGAIVAARIRNGAKFPGGPEKVLDASQVFLRLADTIGPCPASPVYKCTAGYVSTWDRTDDRCMMATGCVKQTPCPLVKIAGCAEGYEMRSWQSKPNGCNVYVCDPAFVSAVPASAE